MSCRCHGHCRSGSGGMGGRISCSVRLRCASCKGILCATRVPSRFRALHHSDLLVGGRFANSSPIRRTREMRVLFHVQPVLGDGKPVWVLAVILKKNQKPKIHQETQRCFLHHTRVCWMNTVRSCQVSWKVWPYLIIDCQADTRLPT